VLPVWEAIVLGPFFTRLPKRRLSLTAQAAFLRFSAECR